MKRKIVKTMKFAAIWCAVTVAATVLLVAMIADACEKGKEYKEQAKAEIVEKRIKDDLENGWSEPPTVYVTDEAGEVSVYKGNPDSMSFSYPVHVEYVTGMVIDDDGCGHIYASSDGVTEPYTFIKYYGITSEPGDEINSVFVYRTDENGNWEDDIVCRIDITGRDWDGTEID